MDSAENQPARTLPSGVWRSPAVWIFAVVLLATLLFVVFLTTQERVPSHAGRSAEAWLLDYADAKFGSPANADTIQQASVEAFREMGTNGISFLVECLGRKDRAWTRMALRLYPMLPTIISQRIAEPVAAEGIRGIAFVVLLDVANDEPDKIIPQVLSHLDSSNEQTRLHTWRLLTYFALLYPTVNYEPYELQLQVALNDTSYWIRLHAVDTMLSLGKADSEMIPALSPALTSGDPTLSNAVQNVIRQLEELPPREP